MFFFLFIGFFVFVFLLAPEMRTARAITVFVFSVDIFGESRRTNNFFDESIKTSSCSIELVILVPPHFIIPLGKFD